MENVIKMFLMVTMAATTIGWNRYKLVGFHCCWRCNFYHYIVNR